GSGLNVLEAPRSRAARYALPREPGSLAAVDVSALFEDHTGQVWVGSRGTLRRFDPVRGTFAPPSLRLNVGHNILSLVEDREGTLWVGPYRGGLVRLDPSRGNAVHYRHRAGDPASLADDEVWSLCLDEAGRLWVATNGGLDRFDPASGRVIEHYGMDP